MLSPPPSPPPEPCDSNPCKNDGECVNIGYEDFECVCNCPFFGDTCEEDNCGGVTCDAPTTFEFQCFESGVYDCETDSCGNFSFSKAGTACDDENSDTFQDMCDGAGQCVGVDACASNPCQNGGVCKSFGDDTYSSFNCECAGDLLGETCSDSYLEEALVVASLEVSGDCPPSNETAYAIAFENQIMEAIPGLTQGEVHVDSITCN